MIRSALGMLALTASMLLATGGAYAQPSYAASSTSPKKELKLPKGDRTPQNEQLLQGPPAMSLPSPYDDALACLASKLTPAERSTTYGVSYFADLTGKTNIAAADATGAYLGQGYDLRLITALKKLGVRVVNVSPIYRTLNEYQMRQVTKQQIDKGDVPLVGVSLPDFIIGGGFNVLDIPHSKVREVTGIVNAGHRNHTLLIGYDAHVTAMQFNSLNYSAGEIPTAFGYTKQIVGKENEVGGTTYLLGGALRSLIGLNFDDETNQPLQYAASLQMDAVAYRAVRDITRHLECDDTFRLSETQSHVETLARR